MTPLRWIPLLWILLSGCATGGPVGYRIAAGDLRYRPATPRNLSDAKERASAQQQPRLDSRGGGGSSPAALVARAAMGAQVERDAFEELLSRAGLEHAQAWPPREADLTPEDAALLYDALLSKPVTLRDFGPRRVALHLLDEIMEGDEELPRAVLVKRLARYRFLAVLRPDGYLAWATSGETQQRVGPVKWEDGAFGPGGGATRHPPD